MAAGLDGAVVAFGGRVWNIADAASEHQRNLSRNEAEKKGGQ